MPPGPPAAAARATELTALDQLLDRRDQTVDLVVGVGSGQLDPEADLVLGDERVCGERDVDAALEQEAADVVDAVVVAQRDLDDRQARAVRRLDVEPVERVEHAGGEPVEARVRSASPRRSLTSKPASTVASDATGDGPEYRYGGAATLSSCLTSVGQAMNASSDE